jgi:RNA polymerase sigma-70 factor (ECF subfamily)
MEDEKIINLFWTRREEAIAEVSGKYFRYCYKIAWNILMNHEDSEECVSDTWVSTWKSIPPQRPSVLSAFLGKITRGHAIDLLRKKKSRKRISPETLEIFKESDAITKSFYENPELYCEWKELLQVLNDFLYALPEKHRDIFIRRYWYFDSIEKIAERHNCSRNTVTSSLFRTRKKLEVTIQNYRKEG